MVRRELQVIAPKIAEALQDIGPAWNRVCAEGERLKREELRRKAPQE